MENNTKNYHSTDLTSFGKKYSKVEMALNSLFDDSYHYYPKGLLINNGNIEIVGIKHEDKFHLYYRIISLESEAEKYKLGYLSVNKNADETFNFSTTKEKFDLCLRKYKDLGMDIFAF